MDPKCELHAERLERLERGQNELLSAINGSASEHGVLSQLALLRQSVDRLTREMSDYHTSRMVPSAAQVMSIIIAAILSAAGAAFAAGLR